ncbi:MAG: ABC transporter permease [Bacilli bacterium]|nr:ABC transporter permease [Bacilli bacterium]MDD4282177.1 ABC transporter permease [Bacilli bacterium]MDD4718544.1 ABC transporter permease [Bacilli bacterium]
MYSKEHIKYLKKIKIDKIIILSIQVFLIILFIGLWQILANYNLINTFVTSSPIRVLKTTINLYQTNNLFQHIFTTIYETVISFSLATLIGIIIATILWWNKFISRVLDPYLIILNSIPKVALGPIIIIWIGAKTSSIIVMALLISVIVTIINVLNGFNKTDSSKIRLMKSLGATKFQTFFKLVLPSSFNNIISALKINVSMSLIGVITGEFLVSKKGIGYLIMYGSQVFNLDLVITGIVILAIVSAIMYYIVYYIEIKLIKND